MKAETEKNKSLNQLLKDNEIKKTALKKIVKGLNSNIKTKKYK